jgi:hypothetical protein
LAAICLFLENEEWIYKMKLFYNKNINKALRGKRALSKIHSACDVWGTDKRPLSMNLILRAIIS